MKAIGTRLVAEALERIERPGNQLGFMSENTARQLVDVFFELLEVAARTGPVKIPLGTFRYVTHAARPITSIKSGAVLEIPAQRKLKFIASPRFRGIDR